MARNNSLTDATNQAIGLDPIVTCTKCGKQLGLSETEPTLVPHADTYGSANYHCRECAEICDNEDPYER